MFDEYTGVVVVYKKSYVCARGNTGDVYVPFLFHEFRIQLRGEPMREYIIKECGEGVAREQVHMVSPSLPLYT